MVYLFCQLVLMFKIWKYAKEDVVIYVNTLLPFGAAIIGKLMGKKVIYHIHETSVKPAFLKSFLKWVAKKTASEAIYVSNYLKDTEGLDGVSGQVIYNALTKEFIKTAQDYQLKKEKSENFTALMLCSLKDYKGVKQYVALANSLPKINFELVLNATMEEIGIYFGEIKIPNNLTMFPRQSNVHTFYNRSNLVINLSHPEQWIETFGMTLLEAMEYGIPTIAPPVGGPAEIVKDGITGYQIDQRKLGVLVNRIKTLANNNELYLELSKNARSAASQFNVEQLNGKVMKVVVGND